MGDTITVTEKRCGKCGKMKPASAFNRNTRDRTGLQGYCRDCNSAAGHDWRARVADPSGFMAFWDRQDARGRRRRGVPPSLYRSVDDLARRNVEKRALPRWETAANLEDFEDTRWAAAAFLGAELHEVHADHIIPLRAYGYIDGKRVRAASGLHCVDNLTWKRVRAASGLHCVDNLTWKRGRDNCSKGASLAKAEAELAEPPTYEQTASAVRIGDRVRLYHLD